MPVTDGPPSPSCKLNVPEATFTSWMTWVSLLMQRSRPTSGSVPQVLAFVPEYAPVTSARPGDGVTLTLTVAPEVGGRVRTTEYESAVCAPTVNDEPSPWTTMFWPSVV